MDWVPPQRQTTDLAQYRVRYNNIGGKAPAIYTRERLFEWKYDPLDQSDSGITTPDPLLLEIHSRFSKATRWAEIAEKIDSRPPIR